MGSPTTSKYGHISGWNTSEVTSMRFLFSAGRDDVGVAAKQFNDDISGWNLDRAENIEGMFYGAESFNQDLSGWNVEKCKNMASMFHGAEPFNKDSIKNWDLSGKDTDSMFGWGDGEETVEEYNRELDERRKIWNM